MATAQLNDQEGGIVLHPLGQEVENRGLDVASVSAGRAPGSRQDQS